MKKNFYPLLRIDKLLPLFSNKIEATTPPQYFTRFWHRQQLKTAILVVGCLVGMVYGAFAAARTASQSGDWNLTTTWGGQSVPIAGDAVTITGFTVTVSDAQACTSLTIGASGVLNNNSSLTVSGSIGVVSAASGGTLTQGTNATLTIGGSWNATTIYVTLNATASGNSVIYNGAGNQTMRGTTYNILTISASAGTKSFNGGATIINSDFTIPSGVSFTTNSQAITFNGDYIFNGATPSFGSSAITIGGTKTAQNISGFTTTGAISMTKTAGTATFTGNVQGSSLTINGSGGTLNLGTGLTHTMTNTNANNAWVRTNGTLDGGSSTLKLAGNGSGAGGTFTPNTGTVEYNSVSTTHTQTIATTTYNNLVLTSATPSVTGNTKSLTGTATVNGNLTINSNVTFSHAAATANIFTVLGNWTNDGTFSGNANSEVRFAGIAAQTIAGANSTTFNKLNVTNTSGAVTCSQAITVSSTTSVSANAILATSAGLTFTGAPTFNGSFQINTGGFMTGTTPTYNSGSTLIYNTASYTASNEFPQTGVKNVTITAPSGTNTVTLNNDKTITGTLTIGNHTLTGGKSITAPAITIGTGTMDMGDITASTSFTCSGASTINLTGSWNVTGFVKSTSTVTFTGSGGGTISSASSFYNLTNTAGTRTMSANINIENTLLVSGGDMRTSGGRSLTMSGSNATINITSGSITGTDAGSTNDLSLIISGAKTTLTGNATSNNDHEKKFFNVTVNNGSTLALARGILCRYGTFMVTGTLQIDANGYVQTSVADSKTPQYNNVTGSLTYNNGGSYTNSGEWLDTNSPVNVTIQNNSDITLSGARTVNGNLTFNTGSLTLNADLTINGNLDLASSKITTGASRVIMSIASSTVSRTTGYIVGNFRRRVATTTTTLTFDIGDASNYAPVTVNFASVTTQGFLTATVAATAHPNFSSSTLNQTKYAQRYWTLTNSSTVFTTYDATFTYVSGDLQGGASGGSLNVGRYASSAWTYPTFSNSGSTTTATGLTAFGDFMLAEDNSCASPTAFNVTGGGGYCSGGTGVAIGLSNSETGVDYQLILSAANDGSPVSGTSSVLSFGLRTVAGTYTVLGTRTSGGCSTTMTGNAVVTVNQKPTVSIAQVNDNCQVSAGSITVTITGGAPNYSVAACGTTIEPSPVVGTYIPITGATVSSSGGSTTFSNLQGNATYKLTVTDNNGCIGQ